MWTRTVSGPSAASAAAAALLCALLAIGCGGEAPPAGENPSNEPAASAPEPEAQAVASPAELFPEGEGRKLVLDNCGACHAIACSAIGQRTSARWDSLKEDHRDKVAGLPEKDLDTLFAYLKQHFNDTKPEPAVPPHFLAGGCTPF